MTRLLALPTAAAALLVLSLAPASAATPPSGSRWVAVVGDYGSRSGAEADVARLVAAVRPGAVVTTGDNLYSDSTYAEAVGAYYCGFIAQAPPSTACPAASMARVNAFFPATGNHDYTDGGIADYLGYFGSLDGSTTYSVVRGGIEFIVVDSQAALDSSESMTSQRTWARLRARTSRAQWQVVVLHHPPSSSSATHGSSPQFRWPFATWGVDLVLSGHDHVYERLQEQGTTFVVDGTGGADLYEFGTVLPGSLARDDTHHGALFLTSTPVGLVGEYWSVDRSRLDRFVVRADSAVVA